ncbi:hypothetical protein B0H14DRAFT_3865506 [Mycena olivaceomarginata]|nr:hypothetical protein B0H14DRAFT_3865506 [Mycena olivaceomarginata]
MRQLSYMLRGREKPDYQATPVVEPHHIAHLEELIEGAGGGWDEFAALVVERVILTSSRADSLGFLAVILIVLQDAQFRRILGEPRVFVSAGILSALVNAVCAVNSRGHHEFCTLLDIAFYLVGMWMVSDMSIMIAALEAGLLRAIVSCSADYPRMNKVHGILQQLPEATIHYYVLRAMRNGMKEVEDIVSGAEFVVPSAIKTHSDDVLGACGTIIAQRHANAQIGMLVVIVKIAAHSAIAKVEFLAANPNQPFYVGFDYTDGRAVVRVYALEDSGGPWGVPRDQCNNEHLMRAERGGGSMVLHRVFVSTGEASYMRWFPLRMTSSVLETGIAALDATAMGKVLETH